MSAERVQSIRIAQSIASWQPLSRAEPPAASTNPHKAVMVRVCPRSLSIFTTITTQCLTIYSNQPQIKRRRKGALLEGPRNRLFPVTTATPPSRPPTSNLLARRHQRRHQLCQCTSQKRELRCLTKFLLAMLPNHAKPSHRSSAKSAVGTLMCCQDEIPFACSRPDHSFDDCQASHNLSQQSPGIDQQISQ